MKRLITLVIAISLMAVGLCGCSEHRTIDQGNTSYAYDHQQYAMFLNKQQNSAYNEVQPYLLKIAQMQNGIFSADDLLADISRSIEKMQTVLQNVQTMTAPDPDLDAKNNVIRILKRTIDDLSTFEQAVKENNLSNLNEIKDNLSADAISLTAEFSTK